MALPTNLAAKIKSLPMDPTVLATNLELAYLLSFAAHPVSHDSIYIYPRDSYQSPLEHYQFADFEDETYQQLFQQTCKNYKLKSKQVAKGIRCGFKEFYARVAAKTHNMAIKYMSRERPQNEKKLLLAKEDEQQYRIEKLKGNNPVKWPETTKDFIKDISLLPWHAFSSDSELMFTDFVESAKNAIANLCHKAKIVEGKLEQHFKQNLLLEIQAFLGVVLRTNNQSFILEQLRFISELKKHLQLDHQHQAELCSKISNLFSAFFSSIPQEVSQKYHAPGAVWGIDPFIIMKKVHFQKIPGLLHYSIATDGTYLYFYISAINGGMFKVGTGNNGSKAGRIYLEKQVYFPIGTKVEEVGWVYLKGKLYLKLGSKDPWMLQVINPNTFQKEGNVQLYCPSLFGQQSLINLNKNCPLLTDGQSLYYLGSRIKISKTSDSDNQKDQKQQKVQKPAEDKKQKDQSKRNLKKKAGKKTQPNENPPPEEQKNQNYEKILEIVLYQFSVQGERVYNDEGIDQKDVDELYDSFSGYFSKNQIKRALILNNYDLAETCQWLFNEGEREKDKNIKVLDEVDHVILTECEITSNFQERAIKGPPEIVVKQGSILAIANLNESLWTMDNQHISCYSEQGLKIFSKNKLDFKKQPQGKLSTTLLKILESKFPRNAECNVIYDPYNHLFYTFTWPQEGHYFPTAVLISSDKKHSLKIAEEKRYNSKIQALTRLSDIQKFSLQHMNFLDRAAQKSKYRFNDWLWYYGQRVIEIGNEMNKPESDKKRLSNKRTKILAKMNKINEIQRIYQKDKAAFAKDNKIVKQIVKINSFEAEGTMKSYRMITQAFKNLSQHPEEIYHYVLCLHNWLQNCSIVSQPDIKEALLELGDKMLQLKSNSTPKNRDLINKLLIQQFYLFFPTQEKQILYITSMNKEELKEFVQAQWKNEKKQKQSIAYELTKKDYIIQKFQTNKCEFSQVFKSQQNFNVNDIEKVELLGNLLLSQVLKVEKDKLVSVRQQNEISKKNFLNFIQKQMQQSEAGNNLVEFLFLSCFKMLVINNKDAEYFYKYQNELFAEVFRIYQKATQKIKNQKLFSFLPTLLMVMQIYHGSLVSVHPNQEIVNSLLKIMEHLQRPQLMEIYNTLEQTQYEGISSTTEKIYETSHPLQRGKNYSFPPRYFHNATLTLLDLDKRCQSDPNNDTLTIQMIHEDSPVGNNIQVNDGVYHSSIRLSGVIDSKKPHLMFSKAVTIDFNSSGHVKDTQSLVRYGFRFGLRPVYTGKVKLSASTVEKITKAFSGIQNFQSYVNSLKFVSVTLSNTIENYLHLQSSSSDPKLDQMLKSKIFKEGFEDIALKSDYKLADPLQTINKFMQKTDQETDRRILKNDHEGCWKAKREDDKKVASDLIEEIWNFEGIPQYIRTYLQQIKEFKGNFIDVFIEARQLAKQKGNYAQIMRRKTVQEHKTLWLQGQAILFLTILKHSGLLHLNLKFSIEYIKENLKAFEDARDGIYNSFISRIQYANEWRHLVQTYIGKDDTIQEEKKQQEKIEDKKPQASQVKSIAVKRKGGPAKTIKIGEKVEEKKEILKKEKSQDKPVVKHMDKAIFEKEARERLSHQSLVKGVCNIKNIKYDENNQFDTVTKIIEQLIKASQQPLQPEDKVYKDPIEHLIRCCLFLLKFKSPSTKQSLSDNEHIVPVGMMRSMSEGASRHCDTNKVNLFRQWLQNWKNWKGFKKEGHVQLQFPVQQIVTFINSWRDLKQINQAINKRYQKCLNRINFYTNYCQLLKILSQHRIIKYVLGSETLNISSQYSSGLESISSNKIKELEQAYKEFKSTIKMAEGTLINQLPLTLEQLQIALKEGSVKFLDKIKLLLHTLFLLESQNPSVSLSTLLYLISFKFLSNQHEDLTYITNSLLHRGFVCAHSNQEIIECLKIEVGNNNISYKRWKDYFFVERVLFLLRKLEGNLRKKQKISGEQLTKIAESIFYILYHIEIPLVAKLGLKILKRLNISLKSGLHTPFDYEYRLFKPNDKNQLALAETFRLPRNTRNNITLLCSKINTIFDSSYSNELAKRFDQNKDNQEAEEKFNIILNLHQEEDLYWMLKVLYYIDELQIKNGEKAVPKIKDFEEYLTLKNRKKEAGEKKQQQQQQQQQTQNSTDSQKQKNPFKEQQKNQRIFNTLPKYSKIDPNLQKQLPAGWFFNYCDVFSDPPEKVSSLQVKPLKNPNINPNNIKNPKNNKNPNNPNNPNQNNPGKKNWNTPIYTKLIKKYEQFNSKPPEQPKENDSAEVKAEFIKARNFYGRVRRYFIEIQIMIDNFSKNGYYIIREDISRKKMNQICQLITSGSMNRLKDVDIDLKNNDIKNRLTFNDFIPNFTTKLKITLIKNKNYSYFNSLITYQSGLLNRIDHNRNNYYSFLGKRQMAFEDSKAFMPYELFIPFDQSAEDEDDIEFGKQWIESNFSKMKKKYQKVYLSDYPSDTFYLSQGGIESGMKDNILVPANDYHLTLQTAPLQKLLIEPKFKSQQQQYEQTELPQELIEKIIKILDKGSIQINKKEDIRDYLLLTFYLQKLKNFNLSFGDMKLYKEFAQKLFKFTEKLRSYKQLQAYKQESQKLILKLIDNQHDKLHLFGTFIPDDDFDDQIEEYRVPFRLEKLNSSNQVKQESMETHSYIKSKYLLNNQPPQIDQNKLLKYWEKNILPKILEFVKTSLKPLQIEDFWEQMRRPLRVGDHTEAKRVAYVICDNKLPAGAVLPDSNHNWNSLEIEQIFVGENVLVKIPKTKADFSTPLLGWGSYDQRLAKIVFIDAKSSSVLVRYRLEELALFSYTWVPVNALMAVEKEVMHISTKSIYEQLSNKLQGMIYIYAKECLTKLASSVSEVDSIKLIKQTIIDIFIKNPISGCFSFPKPVWPMRAVFEKMLEEKNFAILDMLQREFCSIKGIDLNLNQQKMTELNRFQNGKALIVSFKKDARLAFCSGIRFYSDKFGYNEIAHIYAAKTERSEMEPLQFNEPNIYCKFYSNKECLSIQEQCNYKVYPIEATIFAVDDIWTIGCYIGEVVCQIAINKNTIFYAQILQRLNSIFLKWLTKKSTSVLCSYLSKLISKISLSINSIYQKNGKQVTIENLGVDPAQLKEIINWITVLHSEESKEKVVLYSALVQNLSEMVASILVKAGNNFPSLPEHIKTSIDLINIFKEIDSFNKTKKMSRLMPNPPANYQWERILEISNIPSYFSQQTIFKKMKEIINVNKGKILCPKIDIFQKNGRCFILVDGWDINQLIEEDVMEKMDQELPEEQQGDMPGTSAIDWSCPACTFLNPPDVNICQCCQTPAPPASTKQEEFYDEVEATDLKQAERKLQEKEAKRFEEVKVQILKFFEDEYKVVCDLVQKRNQEIEHKEGKKNKKGGKDELQDLKDIPKKPQIKLETGSSIFEKIEIDDFLQHRLEYFPAELKKMVSEEETYIGKFKKLLNLGYDLWGDNISNENATLIPFSHLYLLMDYIQTQICKGSSSVLSYSQDSIRILSQIPIFDFQFQDEPINYTSENDMGVRVKYKALAGQKSYNVRYSWKFVKQLNLAASKCLQLINMDFNFDKERNDTYPVYNDCLGYKIKYYRNLIMGVIKLELFQKIMQRTSVSRENDEVPKITLERLKIRDEKTRTGLVTIKEKEEHLFTKAHDQFLRVSPAFLRPFKPKGTEPYLSFTVNFKGQNVMGQAGPYRQFFTDIGRQLDPQYSLGLFIRSPNNRNQSGQHKSKWVINPKANSTYHFSLFENIGILMGCCFRTGAHIALDLPTMFWKSITHQEITDQDLQQVDQQLISFIRMLQKCPNQEEFQQAMQYTNGGQLNWVYRTCDDQIHDMIYNGRNIKVEFQDIGKYLEMLKLKKIKQTKLQIKRIVKGISQLVPLPYLHCLTGEELKLIICGRPKVDVELLKKHTKYSGGLNEESRRIKFFWEIMREIPETDRLKIIRFCWGQERLPINSEQFERNNTRFMIKPMIANNKNQDQALPKADTCFFNIELPDYSTKAIMKEKLLLAVNLDNVSINADNIIHDDNPLMNEINAYEEEDYNNEEEEAVW